MRKIPTLFVRDPENMSRVLPEVNPACQWAIDGEGTATRKYDGTCVGFFPVVKGEIRIRGGIGSGEVEQPGDLSGAWLARREVKPGKSTPGGFVAEETDPNTGKTVGWEPIEQSSFAKFHAEALAEEFGIVDHGLKPPPVVSATYELIGPKINGNPEKAPCHLLVRHGYLAAVDEDELATAPRDFDGLRSWLDQHSGWEGIVWHHPDGRMAKLKARDFR